MSGENRLTAKMSLLEDITSKFSGIVSAGASVTEQFEVISASSASLESSFSAAASATDYWTESVGGYDKSALSAINSIEELVEQGYIAEAALTDAANATDMLAAASGAAVQEQENLTLVSEEAAEVLARVADSDKLSAETKETLISAMENAEQATIALAAAEELAEASSERLATATSTVGVSQEEFESALSEAASAADDLVRANAKAASAAKELSDATNTASEAHGELGETGVGAIDSLNSALVAAGLTALVKETAEAVYEMVDAFSEAESVIVKATGATGDSLDSLNESMMTVYATVDDADMTSTAGAIGEINTRLGLQGEELENVTSLFMMYADNTGSNVVSAVQNVTKVMNRWGVEVEGTELLLDKFTYAAQVSGASVDTLSSQVVSNKAVLDQLGFSLDESIAMFAQFELAGINSATVLTGFRSALSNGDISSLEDLYDIFEQIESGIIDTEAAASMFGARAGAEIVDAVNSGSMAIDTMTKSIASANGTLAETDEAADTLADKWTMASNSMNAAFTSVLEPAVSAASSSLAGFAQGVGDFLNEHPNVTKALTAVGIGLGVVVAGVGGLAAAASVYSVATTLATAVTATFGVTLSAAIWPITIIAAGIAAVTAAALFLVDVFSSVDEETAGMTATTRDQYYELQSLNDEYEAAVAASGKYSNEAAQLRYQISDLAAEFEASRMTVEEFIAQTDKLVSSHDSIVSSYNDATASIKEEELGTLSLIQKLQDLASSTEQTASTQMQMQTIVDSLNSTYPDLALSVDDVTASTDAMVESLKAVATAQAEQARFEEAQSACIELYREQAVLQDQIAAAEENIRLERERMDGMSGWAHFWTGGEWDDLEAYEEALSNLEGAFAENQAMLSEYEVIFDEVAAAAEESASAMVDSETAVGDAILSVQGEMDELIAAYDAAYESALSSVQGQYSLWDEAADVVATSASSIISNLEGQAAYWQDYNTNLEGLSERSGDIEGLAEMISTFADGSSDSVNAVAGMASATDEELATMVASWQALQEEQASVSGSLAELETDFSAKMSEIEATMQETVTGMNMESEAQEAARATITAYINQIRSMTSEASSAASAVASATSAALSSSGTGTVSVSGYASGTVDADDVYIAGEEGPELIIGAGGSTVFPTSETSQILNAINVGQQNQLDTGAAGSTRAFTETRTESVSSDSRTITLQINGSGAMTVDGSMTEDEVLEILYSNMKPVLLSIVKSEVMEEGEGTYDF